MLLKRLVSAVVLVAITVAAILIKPLFVSVIVVFTFLGLYEFFCMVEKKGVPAYKYFGTIIGLTIPISIFHKFELTKGWELLFIVIALIALFVLQISKKNTTEAVFSISTTLFGVMYIAWLFSFLVKIRLLPYGAGLVGALIFITKASDVGAYLIGSRFGKHLLLPQISPKKSMEGLCGAVVFGILAAFASKAFLPESYIFSPARLLFIGFSLSLLSQLGDLSESLIKRDCHSKDASRLIPGIGGMLDLIDSLLFTGPVFYFYIYRIISV